ncbi:MAG: hypothetical protein EBZ47_00345 [Chlamydiae bacterium]|nr:hypothetical protein [Chlamydiota bacterium]
MQKKIKAKKSLSIHEVKALKSFSWFLFFKQSWWMLFFCAGCFILYTKGMHKKNLDCWDLRSRIYQLHLEKDTSLQMQQELQLQIASQNDPGWIELTLMKQLGVVPEGQRKIYFKKDE